MATAAGSAPKDVGPHLSIGGTASAVWREEALTRKDELKGLVDWMSHRPDVQPQHKALADQILAQLASAQTTASQKDEPQGRWWKIRRAIVGASLERTLGRLDAVEADLLRLAPDDYVCALLPSLSAHVNRFLPKDDPRRVRLNAIVASMPDGTLTQTERGVAIAAFHAANSQRRRELLRLRTFRNMLVAVTVILLMIAAFVGALAWSRPTLLPICFHPNDKIVCTTHQSPYTDKEGEFDRHVAATVSRWDVPLVEVVGLVAAALAGAFSLRGVRGTSTPYSLPVALAGLKLATGALTAFLGLMLMRGAFVPGLSALDSSAQILSWAIVFGYAQQLFTRLVDQQAQHVLQGVGGRGAAGDRKLGSDSS